MQMIHLKRKVLHVKKIKKSKNVEGLQDYQYYSKGAGKDSTEQVRVYNNINV